MTAPKLRRAARLAAVQALYQIEITGAQSADVVQEHLTHRIAGRESAGNDGRRDDRPRPADKALFRTIIEARTAMANAIDRALETRLVAGWPLDRLDPILRATFRAAGAELIAKPDTPRNVILSEFTAIVAAFGAGQRELAFANGVLQGIAEELRPAEEAES